jgi:hypothetical protein
MRSKILISTGIAITLLISSQYSSAYTVNPTDEAAQPCIKAYYGIGQPIDYAKAYKCFNSLHVYQFLILMQLNGDGVPASVDKARKLMKEWQASQPETFITNPFPDDGRVLKILKSTTAKIPPLPRVDFCNDFAIFGFEVRFCSSLDNTLSEQKTNKAFAAIRVNLPSKDAVLWDQIVNLFNEYVNAEGKRGEDAYGEGTLAPTGYDDQQIYVRNSFLTFAKATFIYMKLTPATRDQLSSAEVAMKRAYDSDIDWYSEGDAYQDLNAKSYLSDIKTNLYMSQKTWVDLRDKCSELAVILYRKKAGVNWGLSLKYEMTLVRTEDIKQSTLGE